MLTRTRRMCLRLKSESAEHKIGKLELINNEVDSYDKALTA